MQTDGPRAAVRKASRHSDRSIREEYAEQNHLERNHQGLNNRLIEKSLGVVDKGLEFCGINGWAGFLVF